MRSRASIAIGPSQRSFNGSTCTYRRALSTPHGLLPSDYQDQRPEHRAHAVRGHRGRRPPSLKKGGRSEARHGPPRRPKRLTRQRLGPGTSRGRPGARHPPLRCDTATPGRLPGDLRRRLEHDGQARCSRPGWASLPGPFALAQSASPAAAPGTGSSPKEEVRLDSLGGWCLRHRRWTFVLRWTALSGRRIGGDRPKCDVLDPPGDLRAMGAIVPALVQKAWWVL